MTVQFKQIHVERKRYIRSMHMPDPSVWQSELSELRDTILCKTGLQLVGQKVYFEVYRDTNQFKMMLEVIGPPALPEVTTRELVDLEPMDILVHKLKDSDIFQMNLAELMQIAEKLCHSLDKKLTKDEAVFSHIFHIVYDLDKIELHFFSQKDYIQNKF